ncbi:MAG: DUF4391 domain-containing protein, partial [Terriglobales bacterium]
MNAAAVIAALALPPECLIGRRVPKTLWPEALRDRAGEAIADLRWEAALKPENCGIPACSDVPEIQVLALALRGAARADSHAAHVRAAVPYPALLLLTASDGSLALCIADAPVCTLGDDPVTTAWLPTLALGRQPRASLAAVYGAWAAELDSLRAARIAGTAPAPPSGAEAALRRRQALDDYSRLESEMASLRARAGKEKQIGRRA